jgi:hypothetical protein
MVDDNVRIHIIFDIKLNGMDVHTLLATHRGTDESPDIL